MECRHDGTPHPLFAPMHSSLGRQKDAKRAGGARIFWWCSCFFVVFSVFFFFSLGFSDGFLVFQVVGGFFGQL